eukprot:TRINITY_DN6726_c0_g1_i2.p1 TRINITY_DN6726_c0_g1~~TRINITY_DN6726_c0_g1_i2.p1  ORF type:complete len:122 (-),score=13.21 TRINITY_DN6726_c0_g1_i2:26-391(-)
MTPKKWRNLLPHYLILQVSTFTVNTFPVIPPHFYLAEEMSLAGARCLFSVLLRNKVLTTLNLQDNALGYEGGEQIALGLSLNNTLTDLNLSANDIGNGGALYFAVALKASKTLTRLNLGDN